MPKLFNYQKEFAKKLAYKIQHTDAIIPAGYGKIPILQETLRLLKKQNKK